MKKVLFATTALVAFAGAAAADVTLKGSAEMGITGGDAIESTDGTITDGVTQFHTDISVTFVLSGETDNGLSFGASIGLEEAQNGIATTAEDDFSVFISGDFGRITMGDTDGAFDFAMAEVPTGSGSITDSEEGGAYNGNGGLDGWYDGQILSYTYSVSGFGFAVSAEVDDTAGPTQGDAVMGLGVRYAGDFAGNAVTAGFGYQSVESALGVETNVLGVSGGVTVGDLSLGINYSEMDQDGQAFEITHVGVGASYSLDAWTFGVNFGQYEDGVMDVADSVFSRNHEVQSAGVSAGYDLGGGASILFGYSNTDVTLASGANTDADAWSFGLSMSF